MVEAETKHFHSEQVHLLKIEALTKTLEQKDKEMTELQQSIGKQAIQMANQDQNNQRVIIKNYQQVKKLTEQILEQDQTIALLTQKNKDDCAARDKHIRAYLAEISYLQNKIAEQQEWQEEVEGKEESEEETP